MGGILVAGFVLAVIALSSGSTPSTQTATTNSDFNIATAADVPTPANVQLPPVDDRAVARAIGHLKLALDAEGFSGAMIYSQNCFASLTSRFSWTKLDQCEAFDALAQLAISQSDESGTETTYFTKDAVQSRFTTIASQHQGEVESTQSHLSDLTQAALAKISDLQTEDAEAATAAVGETTNAADGRDSLINSVADNGSADDVSTVPN